LKYTGLGLYVKKDNVLATSVFRASEKTVLANEMKGHEVLESPTGSSIHLGVSFQGMNNARMTAFGSVDFFNNTYWKESNADYIQDVVGWTF
jgi:hypothetical protein